MSGIFTHTPVSEALGNSFTDLGGAGDVPSNLFQGLAANGLSQTAGTGPSQDTSFDAVLKAPAAAPSPFKLG